MAILRNFNSHGIINNQLIITIEFVFPISYDEFFILEKLSDNIRRYKNLMEEIIEFRFELPYEKGLIEKINDLLSSRTYWILMTSDENKFIEGFSKFMLKYGEM